MSGREATHDDAAAARLPSSGEPPRSASVSRTSPAAALSPHLTDLVGRGVYSPRVAAIVAQREAMTHEEVLEEIASICRLCVLWQAAIFPWGGHDCEGDRCTCSYAREHPRSA